MPPVSDDVLRAWLLQCAARIGALILPGDAYACVGSRDTDPRALRWMTKLASRLEARGMILQSGGADGADLAFETGVADPEMKRVFLPRRGFNGSTSPRWQIPRDAFMVAARNHPVWDRLPPSHQKMHARNAQQVLGENLGRPVRFVVCWTADAAYGRTIITNSKTGGTGTAIRIAAEYEIPVINTMPPRGWCPEASTGSIAQR